MGKGQGILPHGDPCRWSRALKSAPASANITRPTHARMLSCRVHGSLTVIIMDMHAPPPPVAAAERGGADKPTVGVHTEPTLATPNPSTPECSRLQYPQHGVRTTAEAFPLPPLPWASNRGALTGATSSFCLPGVHTPYPAPHTLLPCLPPCACLCAPSR